MDDLISRQTVLEGLASIAKAKARSDAQKSLMGRTMFFVERLPSVSTEKTGRWIYKNMKGQFCSICDEQSIWKFNYCPNCGAKMEVKE